MGFLTQAFTVYAFVAELLSDAGHLILALKVLFNSWLKA